MTMAQYFELHKDKLLEINGKRGFFQWANENTLCFDFLSQGGITKMAYTEILALKVMFPNR